MKAKKLCSCIIFKHDIDLEAEFVILPNINHAESWIIPTLIVRKKEIFIGLNCLSKVIGK